MLIDKGLAHNDVVTLKLNSGEELVARFDSESDTQYKITKPMVIAMGPNGPGLMPYLFTVSPDKVIAITKTAVIMISPSDKTFADQYLRHTTGLQMAV